MWKRFCKGKCLFWNRRAFDINIWTEERGQCGGRWTVENWFKCRFLPSSKVLLFPWIFWLDRVCWSERRALFWAQWKPCWCWYVRSIFAFYARYQAEVPKFDPDNIPKRYDVSEIPRQCATVPSDVLFLHQSSVFLPEHAEGENEQSVGHLHSFWCQVDDFIAYVRNQIGADTPMHTNYYVDTFDSIWFVDSGRDGSQSRCTVFLINICYF